MIELAVADKPPGVLPGARVVTWERADLRNIGLILLVFASLLLLISPARSYPVFDDWLYWQSVDDLLRLSYAPHDWSQAIALGHTGWGALFAWLFGNTFTVLTIANLVISVTCLLIFYLLLRHLDVRPGGALLGAAVLGFNPLYLCLSYTFMTDLTFLMYMLVACLFYLRGIQGHGGYWLWLGAVAATLAYMTRQFGLLVVAGALLYLWLSGRWSWQRALTICLLPVFAAVGYAVWERFQPTPLVALLLEKDRAAMLGNPGAYLIGRGQRFVWMLPSLGLCLLPAIRRPRHLTIAMLLFAFFGIYLARSLQLTGTTFPQNGNLLDFTGFIMFFYEARGVWSGWVWLLLGILGCALCSLRFTSLIEEVGDWLRARPWRNRGVTQDPAIILYAWSLLLGLVVVVLTPFLFDRYWLVLLPALLLPTLRRMGRRDSEGQRASAAPASPAWVSWALLVPIALFSVVALRDYKEHAHVRWQAGQSLVAQGVSPNQIKAGFEWQGFYGFRGGAQYIRETGDRRKLTFPPDAILDPIYVISDLPEPSYDEVGHMPYHSWLDGGVERNVLLLKRK